MGIHWLVGQKTILYNTCMFDISQIAQFFQQPFFGLTALDIIILLVFAFYAYEGYMLGFLAAFVDLISFILSFIIGLKGYSFVGGFIAAQFSMPQGFANAIGFFLLAFIFEIVLNIILRRLVNKIPRFREHNKVGRFFIKSDHYLGLLPGFASAFIILSFLLTVVISLPSSPFLKQLVSNSKIGSRLVANTAQAEKTLNGVFGGALNDTLSFLTVEPKSDESVNLHFTVSDPIVDEEAEKQMLSMLNLQRKKVGLPALEMDGRLRSLARNYSADMFKRGYFSHNNPEGQSPFDRMEEAGITYVHAGENLALAPSTELAMQGLMNSPGHKANMLSKNFGHVGIGVMDGGIYGKMFTQEFTD